MAAATITDDPVIARFRTALRETYGDRLERAVLYGSRARGDARKDSDYDVAVFLRDMDDRGAELYRLADLSETQVAVEGEGKGLVVANVHGRGHDEQAQAAESCRREEAPRKARRVVPRKRSRPALPLDRHASNGFRIRIQQR